MPPKLDHSGQFAALLEHLLDGRRCRLVNAEHRRSIRGSAAPDKRSRVRADVAILPQSEAGLAG
jgi:hypothetical protein